MTFAAPLGLLALLALPAIVVLHLFRRRFRERRAAGLFLFAPDALASDAGRRRTRLLRTPSLWLELLAALAAALLLARPLLWEPPERRRLVLVLDGSASLSAQGEDGPADRAARAFARAAIDDLPSDARATVVATGAHPEVLAGPAARPADARAALEAWRPVAGDHDPTPALEVAAEIGGLGATLVYLTDRADRAPPPRWRLVALGAARDNAAVVGARRVRTGTTERVFADVHAFSAGPMRVGVAVRVAGEGGATLGSREVEVESDRTTHLSLEVPATEEALEVALSPDAFATDDRVVLLPEPRAVVPVQVALDAATAEALELGRALDAVGGTRRVDAAADARLRFARATDDAFRGTEVLLAAGDGDRDAWVGPFLVERHPLTRGMALDGVVWSAARADPPGAPLVVAGERTLVAEETGRHGRRVRLNLDPSTGNLPRSPDWPILVANLVEAARADLPGAPVRNVRTGEELSWRATRGADAVELTLVAPSGRRRPASGVGGVAWDADEPGVHVATDTEGREVARFAVQFVDPAESDLRVRARKDEAPTEAAASAKAPATDGSGGTETRLLGLVLLLAVSADWWVLGRRRA